MRRFGTLLMYKRFGHYLKGIMWKNFVIFVEKCMRSKLQNGEQDRERLKEGVKLMDVAVIVWGGKKGRKNGRHRLLASICFWTIKFQSDSMDILHQTQKKNWRNGSSVLPFSWGYNRRNKWVNQVESSKEKKGTKELNLLKSSLKRLTERSFSLCDSQMTSELDQWRGYSLDNDCRSDLFLKCSF